MRNGLDQVNIVFLIIFSTLWDVRDIYRPARRPPIHAGVCGNTGSDDVGLTRPALDDFSVLTGNTIHDRDACHTPKPIRPKRRARTLTRRVRAFLLFFYGVCGDNGVAKWVTREAYSRIFILA